MATSDNFVRPVEIRRYYELQRASYEVPGRVVFRHILVSKRQRGERQARALADEIYASLVDGGDWADLCLKHSDGARAEEGGRMEVAAIEDIGAEALRQAVTGLAPGAISQIIETSAAYIIAALDERQDRGVRAFEDVQQEIHDRLRNERRQEALRRLKARLRAQATVRTRLD
jgi:parvulin-like peptidyl-prolyl isomerase